MYMWGFFLMLHRKLDSTFYRWYEKYETWGKLLFMINPDFHKFTSTEKNAN